MADHRPDARVPIGPTSPSEVLAVIPARYQSQRFPGKVLADLGGRPVLAWVVDAVSQAQRVGRVLVACDHPEIEDAARRVGAEVLRTRQEHQTGSDRVGEAIAGESATLVLNIQGDEPLLDPGAVDQLVTLLDAHPEADVSTLACPCSSRDRENFNVVKVVRDLGGRALYFSRAPIPATHPTRVPSGVAARHVGIYGFRREAFERFLRIPPTPLEREEGLEQLRFLEHGITIVVGDVDEMPPGVDTPEDLERCRARIAGSS